MENKGLFNEEEEFKIEKIIEMMKASNSEREFHLFGKWIHEVYLQAVQRHKSSATNKHRKIIDLFTAKEKLLYTRLKRDMLTCASDNERENVNREIANLLLSVINRQLL